MAMTDGSNPGRDNMIQTTGRPWPLGVQARDGEANFSYAGSNAVQCRLLLYKQGETVPAKEYPMSSSVLYGAVYSVCIQDERITDYEYNFEVDGEVIVDPYARAITGKEQWGLKREIEAHEIRGRMISQDFDWEGDEPLCTPYNEVVAYSLHVRGFTKHPASKVKAKGTFRGLIEKLPYLTNLGINQIHCMPIYEFEECGKYKNYWGYGPAYFFAPKASYAAGSDSVLELKEMVKACHQACIEVILDLPFTAGTSSMMIADCLRYYRTEFHVDGFILNGSVAPVGELRKEPCFYLTKIMEKREDFQNTMRRFLKGDEGMIGDVMFWLKYHSEKEGIFNYVTNHTGFTLADLVSYDGKHNEANGEYNQDGPYYNYSWNCGAEGPSRKKAVVSLRKKQMKNAFFLLLTAQGTPCLLAGDEFANSQSGNNNVYCQDNETGWVDWSKFAKESELHAYVKTLLGIRKSHQIFHPEHELLGMDKSSCGVPDVSYHGANAWQVPEEIASRQLGVYYSARTTDENDCFVAYNMHWLKHDFALPALKADKKWYQVMSSQNGLYQEPKLLENQRMVTMDERSTAIFIGKTRRKQG